MMKRILKSTISLAFAGLITVFSNIPTFAAEATIDNESKSVVESTTDSDVSTFSNTYFSGNVSTSWVTVARSTTGFGCNIYIDCTNLNLAKHDVRMLDKNGNVLWYEQSAIAPVAERIFVCGSDVYSIQLRAQSGTSVVYTGITSEPAN